jgi:hypothetical protein
MKTIQHKKTLFYYDGPMVFDVIRVWHFMS